MPCSTIAHSARVESLWLRCNGHSSPDSGRHSRVSWNLTFPFSVQQIWARADECAISIFFLPFKYGTDGISGTARDQSKEQWRLRRTQLQGGRKESRHSAINEEESSTDEGEDSSS